VVTFLVFATQVQLRPTRLLSHCALLPFAAA